MDTPAHQDSASPPQVGDLELELHDHCHILEKDVPGTAVPPAVATLLPHALTALPAKTTAILHMVGVRAMTRVPPWLVW